MIYANSPVGNCDPLNPHHAAAMSAQTCIADIYENPRGKFLKCFQPPYWWKRFLSLCDLWELVRLYFQPSNYLNGKILSGTFLTARVFLQFLLLIIPLFCTYDTINSHAYLHLYR